MEYSPFVSRRFVLSQKLVFRLVLLQCQELNPLMSTQQMTLSTSCPHSVCSKTLSKVFRSSPRSLNEGFGHAGVTLKGI